MKKEGQVIFHGVTERLVSRREKHHEGNLTPFPPLEQSFTRALTLRY